MIGRGREGQGSTERFRQERSETPRELWQSQQMSLRPLPACLKLFAHPGETLSFSKLPSRIDSFLSSPSPARWQASSSFVFLYIIKARGISSLIDNGPQLRLAKAILLDVLVPYFRIILFP